MLQLTGKGKIDIFASAETQIKGRYVDAGTCVKTIKIKSIAKKGS
ncbi:hypothetical protein ACWYID_03895 [Bacillus rugosus]